MSPFRLCFALALVAASAPASGMPACTALSPVRTFYVSNTSTAAGTPNGSTANPFRTIDAAAQLVRQGDIVRIAPGRYREVVKPACAGTAAKRITFERWNTGTGPVDIVGSIATTGWASSGGGSYRYTWPAAGPGAGEADADLNSNGYATFYFQPGSSAAEFSAFRREMVVARTAGSTSDLEPLRPVQAVADLRPGTFYVHAPACTQSDAPGALACKPQYIQARFWNDAAPAAAAPEISVRSILFRGVGSTASPTSGGGYILRNLQFRFANNMAQQGVICLNYTWWDNGAGCKQSLQTTGETIEMRSLGADSIVEDVLASWNNGAGIDASGLRNVFRRVHGDSNGQMGWGGSCDACLMVDGSMSYNNWKGYPAGWEAGGAKFSYSDGTTIRRMRASSNAGPGIWLDIRNRNNVIEGCLTDDNDSAGIFIESNSTSNLIQHNISTRTWLVDGDVAAGILEQSAYGNFYYHNSLFNNRLQGIFLRNDQTATLGIPGYTGHRANLANNLFVGNGIKSLFGAGNGALENVDAGREMQIEDRCDLGREGIRTSSLNGNVYHTHESDTNFPQGEYLYYSFRTYPTVPKASTSCSTPHDYSFSTNGISYWRDVTVEGPNSRMISAYDLSVLGVNELDLGEAWPGPSANQNWTNLTVPATISVATRPSCDQTINAQCKAHPYGNAGANLAAVFGTWLDNTPAASVAGDASTALSANPAIGVAYPNPFSASVSVRVQLAGIEGGTAELVDVLGRVVARQPVAAGDATVSFLGETLASGTYTLRVRSSDGRGETLLRRIVRR